MLIDGDIWTENTKHEGNGGTCVIQTRVDDGPKDFRGQSGSSLSPCRYLERACMSYQEDHCLTLAEEVTEQREKSRANKSISSAPTVRAMSHLLPPSDGRMGWYF